MRLPHILRSLAMLSFGLNCLHSSAAQNDNSSAFSPRDWFIGQSARAITIDGGAAPASVAVSLEGEGEVVRSRIVNGGAVPAALREIVLADISHGLPAATPFNGEGFAMFSVAIGTIEKPRPLDALTDTRHYRLPAPEGFHRAYNVVILGPVQGRYILVGAASCRRFHATFDINARTLRIGLLAEGLILRPGESWELEEFFAAAGPDRDALLERFAARLAFHHPRPAFAEPPTGWCSWLGYGPRINAEIVGRNLDALRDHAPGLRYVQIDDGYQPWMGDWLDANPAFPGGIGALAKTIADAGFKPAIWVAPFIASPQSRLFREHPDWFVADEAGRPLKADAVTFGGWRQGPWYMLDGTHPEARAYLRSVFETFRSWGITYFKLDANVWGAFPAGRRHDPQATSVEAYRRGMETILEAAGPGSFLLGCNHPLWPSIGVVHGGRMSYDISYAPSMIQRVAGQNLRRNWMNGRLWWNDPDTLLLRVHQAKTEVMGPDGRVREGTAGADALSFHFAATLASGGLLLAGDRMADYGPEDWRRLHVALAAPRASARFTDDALGIGWADAPTGERWVYLLNWDKSPARREVPVSDNRSTVRDPINQTDLSPDNGRITLELPPFSGRVLVITPPSPVP